MEVAEASSEVYDMGMRSLVLLILAGLLGCSRPVVPPGAVLAQTLAGSTAGRPQDCVPVQSTSNLRVIDAATLGYGSGSTIYVNRLAGPCPGARELSTNIVEDHGSTYCRCDHFRAVEVAGSIPGPTCALGDWVPYRRP
jgi:hypothetical protein